MERRKSVLKDSQDRKSKSLTSIDLIHNRVHDGICYSASKLFETVSSGSSVNLRIQSHDKELHIVIQASANAETDVEFYSGADVSGGTTLSPNNRNLEVNNPSDADAYYNTSITSTGNEIAEEFIGGGEAVGGRTIGAGAYSRAELVLKPNTDHVIKASNTSSSDSDIFLKAIWYEVL